MSVVKTNGQSPDEILVVERLVTLQEGRDQLDATRQESNEILMRDPFWNSEERIEEWLALLPTLEDFPALPATAIALHAWDNLCRFQHRNATMGRLLASSLLMKRGKVTGQILCLNVGLKAIRWYERAAVPVESWIKEFCRAVTRAVGQGLQLHQQLLMARRLMAWRLGEERPRFTCRHWRIWSLRNPWCLRR